MKSVHNLIVVMSILFLSVFAVNAKAEAPLPIDYWAIRDSVNTVSVSPNGKHVLLLKIASKEGEHILEIYETDDFSKPLRRLNAKPMEFTSARWVSDSVIVGTAWKVVRKSVKGPEEDVRSYKLYAYDLETNKFSEAKGSFGIVGNLPKEPNHILIATDPPQTTGVGIDPFAAFRPRAFYKYNLKTGSRSLVMKGSRKFPGATFDIDGNPRFTSSVDPDTNELITYYRLPGDGTWKEFGERYDFDDEENLYRVLSGIHGYVGSKHDDPTIGYIIDNRGEDKTALWEYDFKTKKFGKKLYSNPDADVMGIVRHSNFWGGNNKLVGVRYSGAKREIHWFDQEEKALVQQFESKIPNAHQVSIGSRSRDGNTMIVINQGPKDPGSYWLVKNGKMAKLASRNPLLKPENLSNVEYIRYPARDGMTIPAYVTKPKGPGPHPLIVLPHGGPHVNEVIGYDEWGQLLANNGYMVLQPQYRMSVGWGKKHFDSAFGQHGLAMQDDKDDGAKYLINKGWADKDRVAMFGWSYGGYAALVAASRPDNIYQCVIAGAAVADAKKVYLKRSRGSAPKALEAWSRARGGYVGINPIDEIDKVNIPVMMVHGDVDARVLYFNMKDYKNEMEKALKTKEIGRCTGGLDDAECTTTVYRSRKGFDDAVVPANLNVTSGTEQTAYTAKNRFVTLKGADHFSRTLMYGHQKKLYTSMLDYLKNDCGPGGL